MTVNCHSFVPAAGHAPRVLILGSMPGAESLRRQQYYAFRHNAFWRIMEDLFGIDRALPYAERLAALNAAGVALWDVCGSCERKGSLDAAIRNVHPNAIAELLTQHSSIRLICCNGGTAGRLLKRFFPALPCPVTVLPSTSPAAARFTYAEKLTCWREALYPETDFPNFSGVHTS